MNFMKKDREGFTLKFKDELYEEGFALKYFMKKDRERFALKFQDELYEEGQRKIRLEIQR